MLDILANIDWTPFVEAIIAIAGSVLVGQCAKYVVPWLKENQLMAAAQVAVEAAEAIYGRYNGEEKWKTAMQSMIDRGFNVDSNRVYEALKAAWKKLDLQQLASGEKVAEDKAKDNE